MRGRAAGRRGGRGVKEGEKKRGRQNKTIGLQEVLARGGDLVHGELLRLVPQLLHILGDGGVLAVKKGDKGVKRGRTQRWGRDKAQGTERCDEASEARRRRDQGAEKRQTRQGASGSSRDRRMKRETRERRTRKERKGEETRRGRERRGEEREKKKR